MGAAPDPVGAPPGRGTRRSSARTRPGTTGCGRRAGARSSWTRPSSRCSRAPARRPGRRSPRWGGTGEGCSSPDPTSTCSSSTTVPIADAVARLADALLYPLWNDGTRGGSRGTHARRSAKRRAERLDVGAAMLDIRLLAGDEEPRGGRRREGRGVGSAGPARVRDGAPRRRRDAGPSGSARPRICSSPTSRRVPADGATSTRSGCSSLRSGCRWRRPGCSAAASAKRSRPRRSSSSGCGARCTSRPGSGAIGWSSITSPRSRGRWGSRTSRGSSRSTG